MAKNSMIGRFASGKAKDMALKSAFDENGNPTEGFEKAVFTTLDDSVRLPIAAAMRH